MSATGPSPALRTIGIVLLLIGIVALVVGVIYYVEPASSLPSFLGRLPRHPAHRTKRGLAAVVAGGVFVIGGAIAFFSSRRSDYR